MKYIKFKDGVRSELRKVVEILKIFYFLHLYTSVHF